ncbi:MAG: hypothetical protein AB7D57_03180, partial [Desulfovibrionaceae bacterium]
MSAVDALVVIQNSWGEVDWILPVLRELRRRAGARILVHFPLQGVLDEGAAYRDLDACLRATARVMGPADVARAAAAPAGRLRLARRALRRGRLGRATAWRLMAGGDPGLACLPAELLHAVTGGDPAWLLHDYSGQGHALYQRTFPGSRLVLFPHGTAEYLPGSEPLRHIVRRSFGEQPLPPEALVLVGTEGAVEFFRAAAGPADIRAVGHPMLDPAWQETLRGFRPEAPDPVQNRAPAVVLACIPMRKFPGRRRYLDMVRQVAQAAAALGRALVLKPHPRQAREEVRETLAALDAPDTPDAPIRVADVSLASALVPGDLAVVFPSSAGNQAVARGIPVVEYFDYAAGDWPSYVPAEGGRTSVYRALGLALPADDPAGLAAVLGGLA